MTKHEMLFAPQGDDAAQAILKVVIMAVGGQGGGVLTNWVEAVARASGRAVQATSVAGVAQRTGATIYYIEIGPEGAEAPVFSLAPAGGDVDVLIAAELMEAGRAIQRGFVTPDRTTLIASTHRALAVSEKMEPGNGIASAEEILAAAEIAAQRLLIADMEKLAVDQGSVISASLFGALAGAKVLPFEAEQFREAIRASGKAVEASLRAFEAGFASVSVRAVETEDKVEQPKETLTLTGPEAAQKNWSDLLDLIGALPEPVQDMAVAGLRKVVEFQDVAYGAEYLTRLEAMVSKDCDEAGYELTREAAKYIANAMAYDDVIRVADRKTRGARGRRIDAEMGKSDAQVLQLTEFFHPRAEEIAGLLPAQMGERVENSEKWMARLDRWFNKGRRIRTDTLRGFVPLYVIGGLRKWRLKTRRHAVEAAHMEAWLADVDRHLAQDYALAVEVLRCRRLIKGYSDTHARGLSKFDRVMAGIELVAGRQDAADWARRLRDAALKDEEGKALEGALQTIRSFAA